MLDWRQAVDEMRHLIRSERSNGKTELPLTEFDHYLDHVTSTFTLIEKRETKEEIADTDADEFQELVQKQKDLISNVYAQAHHYTTVIVFGGYAALFTLWNFTKEVLWDWQVFVIGLSITISMMLYISSEIYGAWKRGKQAQTQMNDLNDAQQMGKFPDEYGKLDIEQTNNFMAIWHYFFIGTVFFAVLAAFILLYSFIDGLLYEFL